MADAPIRVVMDMSGKWPGQPVTSSAAPQWPGTPAPAAQTQDQWPGTPMQQTAPSAQQKPPVAPQPPPPDEEDHGYLAETAREFGKGKEAVQQYFTRPEPGVRGALENMATTAGAAGGVVRAAASPLTGAIRSFGGRAAQGADELMRSGAEKIYGPEKVEKAAGPRKPFEDYASGAETLSGIAMPGVKGATPALQAARNAMGVIEKIFSPETVDAHAKAAVSFIRDLYGQAARHTAITEQSIEKGWRTVNAMPQQDKLHFIDYVEGRSTTHAGQQLSPDQQDLADTLRTAFEQRMRKLQALPKHAQQGFIDDYFPHFWKEPGAAANIQPAQAAGGASRQGSGASLKTRSVPTISDGIAAGLTPVTENPLEATMRYVTSMDRFIASEAVMQTAKDQGYVRFIRPKVMGASGHPESFKVPDGWAPLAGRGARDASGAQAYAPEGFARIYNNFISRGIAELDPALGTAYEAARRSSNAITALELGLSGYHALTMGQEAMVNQLANAVGYARRGAPLKAGKALASTAVAPVSLAVTGKKVQNVYLGLSQGSPELQKVVELLTQAGGRAKGVQHAPDYNFSKTGSYWTAFKRGALKLQAIADFQEAKARPIVGTAKVAARNIGRIMQTVAQPIFEKYIPLIKNGAFYENMSAWLHAHPMASPEEQVHAARQIWDSVDNRFGEMVQDNIFMNKVMKQVGMLSLRSWSWTIGSGREILGAARDVARATFKTATGTGPQDTKWTSKMDYAIALPVVYGTLSAIYQALKTGKPPESVQDLLAPRTGGADASTGEPERLIMPGYMKDVFGFYQHPVEELTNKAATAPRMGKELLTNRDWRDDPIFNANDTAPNWLKQFWDYAVQNIGPLSLRSLKQGQKEGSNISRAEGVLGVRPAPRYLTDPEGYEQMMRSIHGRQWQQKLRHDRKTQQLYGGGE